MVGLVLGGSVGVAGVVGGLILGVLITRLKSCRFSCRGCCQSVCRKTCQGLDARFVVETLNSGRFGLFHPRKTHKCEELPNPANKVRKPVHLP